LEREWEKRRREEENRGEGEEYRRGEYKQKIRI